MNKKALLSSLFLVGGALAVNSIIRNVKIIKITDMDLDEEYPPTHTDEPSTHSDQGSANIPTPKKETDIPTPKREADIPACLKRGRCLHTVHIEKHYPIPLKSGLFLTNHIQNSLNNKTIIHPSVTANVTLHHLSGNLSMIVLSLTIDTTDLSDECLREIIEKCKRLELIDLDNGVN